MEADGMKSKKEKAPMSVKKQILYKNTILGLAWICVGILEFFDNAVCKLIAAILTAAILWILCIDPKKNEKYDEMAIYDLTVARSKTLKFIEFVILLLAVLLLILEAGFGAFDLEIPDITVTGQYIKPAAFIFMGAVNFLIGINFHLLEKE